MLVPCQATAVCCSVATPPALAASRQPGLGRVPSCMNATPINYPTDRRDDGSTGGVAEGDPAAGALCHSRRIPDVGISFIAARSRVSAHPGHYPDLAHAGLARTAAGFGLDRPPAVPKFIAYPCDMLWRRASVVRQPCRLDGAQSVFDATGNQHAQHDVCAVLPHQLVVSVRFVAHAASIARSNGPALPSGHELT
jgi:hypothetical protein